jgi:ATP-dependent exoDNAse (exonuclease V) beta subunit
VREALGVWTTDHFASPGELLWAHPESIEEGWWERIPTEERGGTSETSGPRAVPRIELGRPRGARRRLDRTSPSGKEGGARIDVRLLLGLNDVDGRARARGTLVHAWMEEIDWIESSTLSDDLALEIARRVTPELREEVVQEYLAWLRHALEAPEVTRALSKERAPPGADPRAEVPILVRDGDDALMRGFIDRLVVTREGSEIVRARILDYKTDRFAPGDPAALRERVDYYRPQLDAYREAVRRQFGVAPDAISAALVFLEVGRVVEC